MTENCDKANRQRRRLEKKVTKLTEGKMALQERVEMMIQMNRAILVVAETEPVYHHSSHTVRWCRQESKEEGDA